LKALNIWEGEKFPFGLNGITKGLYEGPFLGRTGRWMGSGEISVRVEGIDFGRRSGDRKKRLEQEFRYQLQMAEKTTRGVVSK
jgi:hypothetical protein